MKLFLKKSCLMLSFDIKVTLLKSYFGGITKIDHCATKKKDIKAKLKIMIIVIICFLNVKRLLTINNNKILFESVKPLIIFVTTNDCIGAKNKASLSI
jgi:hypothetical protein